MEPHSYELVAPADFNWDTYAEHERPYVRFCLSSVFKLSTLWLNTRKSWLRPRANTVPPDKHLPILDIILDPSAIVLTPTSRAALFEALMPLTKVVYKDLPRLVTNTEYPHFRTLFAAYLWGQVETRAAPASTTEVPKVQVLSQWGQQASAIAKDFREDKFFYKVLEAEPNTTADFFVNLEDFIRELPNIRQSTMQALGIPKYQMDKVKKIDLGDADPGSLAKAAILNASQAQAELQSQLEKNRLQATKLRETRNEFDQARLRLVELEVEIAKLSKTVLLKHEALEETKAELEALQNTIRTNMVIKSAQVSLSVLDD